MKSEKLLRAIGQIDDELICAAIGDAKAKRKTSLRLRWSMLAACLLLVAGGMLVLPRIHDSAKVIGHYETNSDACYPTPDNGQIVYETEVKEAREHYHGKNVTYLLGFEIFENEETVSNEKKEAEYRRLAWEGYELYAAESWSYQGESEKIYDTVVVGNFTEEQLTNFKSRTDYGYFFYFVKNGDGSDICVNSDDRITEPSAN